MREELAAKGQRVRDALERVGGVHLELPPVLGAESPLRYRNKVQFPVSPRKVRAVHRLLPPQEP